MTDRHGRDHSTGMNTYPPSCQLELRVRKAACGAAYLGLLWPTLGCEDEGPSAETISRAEAAYVECMAEHGLEVEHVSLSPDNVDVRLVPGDYTDQEATAATLACEERVALIFDGAPIESQEQCEHQLSSASDAAGELGEAFASYSPDQCQPNTETWDVSVQPLLETRCGLCHGEEPAFGATVSLTDYDILVEGPPGDRLVDRIALRTAAHTMPPPNSPQLDHAELDLLVEWATCGFVHPDATVGLDVSRDAYAVDVPENLTLPHFELLAPDFKLGQHELDRYQCFAFDVPVDEDRYMKRIQIALDESRVLHHVLVLHDPERVSAEEDRFRCEDWPRDETPILWGWAPGGGAFDFEEGGLLLQPTDRIVIQIHYNNGAGLADVQDSSGIRIFHGPAEGRQWQMVANGPDLFAVPEGESVACGNELSVDSPHRVLAAFPHMHRLGAELHTYVQTASGRQTPLIDLSGWNFEAQRFYEVDTVVEAGDSLHTWCGFRNGSGRPTKSGSATDEEMCLNFLYVSPEE